LEAAESASTLKALGITRVLSLLGPGLATTDAAASSSASPITALSTASSVTTPVSSSSSSSSPFMVETPAVVRMAVDLPDVPSANLLDYLDAAVDFCLNAGSAPPRSVLIHCVSGVSRSCAVAAACIMRDAGVSAAGAVEHVRRAHPAAEPNEGFIAQLRLYETMGAHVDKDSQAYRRFLLERAAREYE
ncbi:hypothetical protein HK405_001850, partial [Cladochytrium tenue]